MEEPWRILEFYSGIGGMRYSLLKAGIRAEVVEAFDINDTANDVYEHNFGHRPLQGNIQSLTALELDKYRAHAWLLSPPCQPYTRQGLQKHSADARASSFIKVLDLLQHMLQPPFMLFVENVIGFETSDTHEQMLELLAKIGFVTQEYILSPLQFGVPYSRPRYFCLAKRKPLSFQTSSFNSKLLRTPGAILKSDGGVLMNGHHNGDGQLGEGRIICEPIKNFLEGCILDNHQHTDSDFRHECSASTMHCGGNSTRASRAEEREASNSATTNIREEFEGSEVYASASEKYKVPMSLIERWGSAMDVVYPDSKRCCCFTKSYYRYVKGTGSLLKISLEAISSSEPPSLKDLGLRYFTPREVASLHSFPKDFCFPSHVSLRQQYALLGNSLSIAVAAPLLSYLFAEPTQL